MAELRLVVNRFSSYNCSGELYKLPGGIMQALRKVLALLLCCSVLSVAQGNSFTKVRYNGGSISTKVKPDDWDNKLTVSSDAIVFTLKDAQSINIQPAQVTSLSYGQEAHRKVGTAIGLGILSLGAGALFAIHKTKLHYIGVNYSDKEGKKQGLLLQGDKSNFRAIIVALQGVTGVPVSVGEKDRSEIPAGIAVQTAKQPEEVKASAQPEQKAPVAAVAETAAVPSVASPAAPELLMVASNPAGAEIYLNESFVGNTPATIKLKAGKHTVVLRLAGYKDWSREIVAEGGTEAHFSATLEKN